MAEGAQSMQTMRSIWMHFNAYGIPEELLNVKEDSQQHADKTALSDDSDDEGPPHIQTVDSHDDDIQMLAPTTQQQLDSYLFMPLPQQQRQEDAIRALVNGDDPLEWPTISGQPINEFHIKGLASKAYSALFPHGTGDPTCKAHSHEVTLTHFASHPFSITGS